MKLFNNRKLYFLYILKKMLSGFFEKNRKLFSANLCGKPRLSKFAFSIAQ